MAEKIPKYIFDGYLRCSGTKDTDVLMILNQDLLNTKKKMVALFRDGHFVPAKTGAAVSILGMLNALYTNGNYMPVVIKCKREHDLLEDYKDIKFPIVFVDEEKFYYDKNNILSNFFIKNNISIIHLGSSEAVLSMADTFGNRFKYVFEVHNVDADLYRQLGKKQSEIDYIANTEKDAIKICDCALFRSNDDVKKYESLLIPKNEVNNFRKKVRVYRGGIDTNTVKFTPDLNINNDLVFMGHLNYEPNIKCLENINNYILGKISNNIRAVGLCKVETQEKFKGIHFTGYVKDINIALKNTFIGLAPITEASGTRLKVLDYLAKGLPVLATSLATEGLEKEIYDIVWVENDLNKYPNRIEEIKKAWTPEISKKIEMY